MQLFVSQQKSTRLMVSKTIGPGPGQDEDDWDDDYQDGDQAYMTYTNRIATIIKKILPLADVYVEYGQEVNWIDIVSGGSKVTIEHHDDKKFGVIIPGNPKNLMMAEFYFDSQFEALDIAIKLLTYDLEG